MYSIVALIGYPVPNWNLFVIKFNIMPIYFGKSADGSDAQESRGMFISPDGNSWSNMPFTKEQKYYQIVYDYMCKHLLCLDDIKKQIDNKTCRLSKGVRKYVLSHYDEHGNFKNQD